MKNTRRTFIKNTSKWALAASASSSLPLFLSTACSTNANTSEEAGSLATAPNKAQDMFFKISLAEWSLRHKLGNGTITNLDFPAYTKETFGIDGVEYVNQYFFDKAKDQAYLKELKQRSADAGVENILIMVDREGQLAHSDETERKKSIENHYKWIEAAKTLGCSSVRVNAYGEGSYEETMEKAVESMRVLTEFADPMGINVVIENHGGHTSNGYWLANVMKKVDHPRCGTLPDFGNFTVDNKKGIIFDYLMGVKLLMPYAKGVSAKSFEFDAEGNETVYDYRKLLSIVKTAGYKGYIGVEWGGKSEAADEGIIATRDLLIKLGKELS